MGERPRSQDWTLLGLNPGASSQAVEEAFEHKRRLYEGDTLATYSLFDEHGRKRLLERLTQAYERILTSRSDDQARAPGASTPLSTPHELSPTPGVRRDAWSSAGDDAPNLPPSQVEEEHGIEPPPDPQLSPGPHLRYHRLRQSRSLEQAAEDTKIRRVLLEQIETHHYSGLPAPVYVRGFVISYARFLNLPHPERIAAAFLDKMNQE